MYLKRKKLWLLLEKSATWALVQKRRLSRPCVISVGGRIYFEFFRYIFYSGLDRLWHVHVTLTRHLLCMRAHMGTDLCRVETRVLGDWQVIVPDRHSCHIAIALGLHRSVHCHIRQSRPCKLTRLPSLRKGAFRKAGILILLHRKRYTPCTHLNHMPYTAGKSYHSNLCMYWLHFWLYSELEHVVVERLVVVIFPL